MEVVWEILGIDIYEWNAQELEIWLCMYSTFTLMELHTSDWMIYQSMYNTWLFSTNYNLKDEYTKHLKSLKKKWIKMKWAKIIMYVIDNKYWELKNEERERKYVAIYKETWEWPRPLL